MPDSGRGEAFGQDARAVLDVVLVAPPAVDVDAGERLQVAAVPCNEIDRVVPAPIAPALLDRLARLEVERNAEAERRLRIRIVSGRRADVHDAEGFLHGELFLLPHVREESPDAPVVVAFGEALAAGFAARVVGAGLSLGQAVLRELVQRVRPVVPVYEIEIRVAGMIGDRAPGSRVLHAVEDRAVPAG